MAHDGGPSQLRCLGVGGDHAGGIDVTLVAVPHRAHEIRGIHEREDLGGFPRGDDLGVHSQVPAAGMHHLQPIHPLRRIGQLQSPTHVESAVLPGHLFEFRVELNGVSLEFSQEGVAVVGVDDPGRMPRRSRGQVATLHQHHVGPACLGEVVEHRTAHHSSADDNNLGLGFHVRLSDNCQTLRG